ELLNNKISVLENKDVYPFLELSIFEDLIVTSSTQDVFSSFNIGKTVMVAIILIILPMILMIGIFFGNDLFSGKLTLIFSYSSDELTEFNLNIDKIGKN